MRAVKSGRGKLETREKAEKRRTRRRRRRMENVVCYRRSASDPIRGSQTGTKDIRKELEL
jgi:hypothetical protein